MLAAEKDCGNGMSTESYDTTVLELHLRDFRVGFYAPIYISGWFYDISSTVYRRFYSIALLVAFRIA